MKTGVIILNYNNSKDTINCLKSLIKYTNKDKIKIIVVDNGSTNNSVIDINKFLLDKYKTEFQTLNYEEDINQKKKLNLSFITLLISKKNEGYAIGNNKGIEISTKDDSIESILILNNDILFTSNILDDLLLFHYSRKNVGISCPLLLKKDMKEIDYTCARKDYKLIQMFFQYLFLFIDVFHILTYFNNKQSIIKQNPSLLQKRQPIEIEMPSGSCMLISKKLLMEIGLFDRNTFLYFEENILYQQIKQKGYKNYILPYLNCIHLGASTSKTIPSIFTMKCHINSNLYYIKKYKKNKFLYYFIRIMTPLILSKIKIIQHIKKN